MPKVMKRDIEEILRQVDEDISNSDKIIAQAYKSKACCKVQCPCCGGVFFETTDKFDVTKPVTPNMIKLLDTYADWGWAEVIPDNSAGFGALYCPECDSMIAPEGKLTLMCGNKD